MEAGKISKITGFTLIELLIVIAVVGGLSTIFITTYPSAQRRGRDTHRRNDVKQYQNALEIYANKNNGVYPVFLLLDIDPSVVNTGPSNDLCSDKLGFSADECPSDPRSGLSVCSGDLCQYHYNSSSNGTRYTLWARLEQPVNPAAPVFVICSEGTAGEKASQTCP